MSSPLGVIYIFLFTHCYLYPSLVCLSYGVFSLAVLLSRYCRSVAAAAAAEPLSGSTPIITVY